jgi:hypothetical protein
MQSNYIILSKSELEKLLRNAYLSGQNHTIMISHGLNQTNIDDFIANEMDKFAQVSKVKHNNLDGIDGWGGC